MAYQFPKLLIATEFSPNAAGGGGAVFRQMLKDWPAENLFWWSCFSDYDQRFGQKVAAHFVATIPRKLYPHRRALSLKTSLLEHFWTPWAARHLRKTLAAVKPDVIWVLPHVWAVPPLARVLPHTKIGFHVSIHDFADSHGANPKLVTLANQLYAAATTRDAISQPMREELRAKTGRDGNITRAGLEPEDFEELAAKTAAPVDTIRIAYAGTIIVENEFALFIRALARIRNQLPRPVTIEFFGDHSYRSREWFDASWMNEHGNLSACELSNELKKCAWGFSPMGLIDEKPRYNRFSLPTKFVSYLAAGLPVITLGHPESCVVKIAGAHDLGLCVTSPDLEKFSGQLLAVLSEPNPWQKYRDGILGCAKEEFDAKKMRAVLFNCFEQCAVLTHK
jgi:hypothetical protein